MNNKLFKLIRMIFLFFGVDMDGRFEGNPRISRALTIWRRFIPVFMTLGMVQIWIKLLCFTPAGKTFLTTFFVGVLGFQSLLKSYMMNQRIDEMTFQLSKIHAFHTVNYGQLDTKGEKLIKLVYRCCFGMFVFLVVSCNLIYFVNLIKIIVDGSLGMKTIIKYGFKIYWPFDESNHRIIVLLYTSLLLNVIEFCTFVIDQMSTYTAAYLAICLDRLGEEFRELIDGSDARAFRETKKMLAACIDKHNQLIEICEKVNSIYGISLLVFTLQASMAVCFMGFNVLVSILKRSRK
jgi:hypothetical protein